MKWKQNAERNAKVIDLFRELKSTRLVADQTGIPQKTVAYILNSHGIPTPKLGMRSKPNAACDVNAAKVLQMCEDGCSLAEMAKAVGTVGREVKKFLRRNGVTKDFPTTKIGEKHYAWRGRMKDSDGYIQVHVKGHPNARKHTHYILEHRLVMEEFLGRHLLPTEVVHHINGVKDDNRIENLQLFDSNGAHLAVDLKGRCPNWTPEGKERIRKANLQRWSARRTSTPAESESGASPCI
jgi:hypothetical protein